MKTFTSRTAFLKGVRKQNLRIALRWGQEDPLNQIFAYDHKHDLVGYYTDKHGDIAETDRELALLQANTDHPEK